MFVCACACVVCVWCVCVCVCVPCFAVLGMINSSVVSLDRVPKKSGTLIAKGRCNSDALLFAGATVPVPLKAFI